MSKVIVYPNQTGGIVLLIPVPECGIPLGEIARKDTPAGAPFKFVDITDVPEDHTFFSAWEVDFSKPDGYGIGNDAWFSEQGQA